MGRRTESLLPCGSGYYRFQAHSGRKEKEDAGMQEGNNGSELDGKNSAGAFKIGAEAITAGIHSSQKHAERMEKLKKQAGRFLLRPAFLQKRI